MHRPLRHFRQLVRPEKLLVVSTEFLLFPVLLDSGCIEEWSVFDSPFQLTSCVGHCGKAQRASRCFVLSSNYPYSRTGRRMLSRSLLVSTLCENVVQLLQERCTLNHIERKMLTEPRPNHLFRLAPSVALAGTTTTIKGNERTSFSPKAKRLAPIYSCTYMMCNQYI
jgi:hypothetical protein